MCPRHWRAAGQGHTQAAWRGCRRPPALSRAALGPTPHRPQLLLAGMACGAAEDDNRRHGFRRHRFRRHLPSCRGRRRRNRHGRRLHLGGNCHRHSSVGAVGIPRKRKNVYIGVGTPSWGGTVAKLSSQMSINNCRLRKPVQPQGCLIPISVTCRLRPVTSRLCGVLIGRQLRITDWWSPARQAHVRRLRFLYSINRRKQ